MKMTLPVMTLAIALAGSAAATAAEDLPTAAEIIESIKAQVNCPWKEPTVDTFKAGDPKTPITGIAVTFMATQEMLKKAVAANCNLVITHEPTFYAGKDDLKDIEDDPVVAAKRAYIDTHGLAIWRFHDHAHRHNPDMINEGMIDAMGLRDRVATNPPVVFALRETTVAELAADLKKRLGARSVDIVGDAQMKFTKAGFSAGCPFSLDQMKILQRDDVEVLIAGETRQWETVPYVQDAATQGRHKALILLGHANSEEAGMRFIAKWLGDFVKRVPVKFIPSGDPMIDVAPAAAQ